MKTRDAIRGISSRLCILVQRQYDGSKLSQQSENDLRFLRAVLDNVINFNCGGECIPLPSGSSGFIARHFLDTRD